MRRISELSAVLALVLSTGCGEEPISQAPPATSAAVSAVNGVPKEPTKPEAELPDGGLPEIDYQELEFGESERSRDPFRSYAESFVEEARGSVKSQREVVLSEHSLDDLKLTAIVLRANPSRAMLVDPSGKGHVVRRGQFVGRPDTVAGNGQSAPSYEVNWRIDQIRSGDIVLVREDPNNPDVPTATKVISMRPDSPEDAE